jgi:NADPH:quinone reductase-like Zn-dependent oxidoreductase
MRAAVYRRYGPPEVVRIEDVPKPVPKDDEVLIRVHATTVAAADWRLRRTAPVFIRLMNGLWRPTKTLILGMEFSGTIESVGKAVARFRAGDEVFGSSGFHFGAHAEYLCLPESGMLAAKPANMPPDEAAAVMFGGISALHFLKEARIQAGQRVLIYGASGSVGVFAVQLAKHFGANVTAVCSTANLELVKSLGADAVVDYTKEDFSKAGRVYDIVFDAVGYSGFRRSLRSLKHGCPYVRCGAAKGMLPMLGAMLRGAWISWTGAAKVVGGVARFAPEYQALLKELIETGKLRTVIDKRYPLDRIAEAHRHAEAGHKKGHVLILVEQARA